MRSLNRNVLGIGLADLAADANYEMVFAVLPLFITTALGAPALAVGLIEGVGDGSSAVVKLWSGWFSDRIACRRQLAVGGYGTTVFGLGLIVAITSWPQVVVARALAWMGRGLRQPIRSAMFAGSVEKTDLGKAFGFHEALDTAGALIPVGSPTRSAKRQSWLPHTSASRPPAWSDSSATAGLAWGSWLSWWEPKIRSSAQSKARW